MGASEPQPDSHVVLGGETGLLQVVSRLRGVLAAKEPPGEPAMEEPGRRNRYLT